MDPVISIVIPTFNPGDYLFYCLDSLLSQSISRDKFEIILVLNGAEQPYRRLIESYVAYHCISDIVHLEYTKGSGVSNARNVGLDLAVGDFIAFIDDDDYVSQTYLEKLLEKATPDTIAISNALSYMEEEKTLIDDVYSKEYKKKNPLGKQPYQWTRRFFSGPWMKLIHRDVIGLNRFDINYSNGEDSLFMFAISANMKYVDFASTDAIYYRRIRNGSAMSNEKGVKKVIKNRLRMISSLVHIYIKDPQMYSFHFLVTRILGCIHSISNSIIHQ